MVLETVRRIESQPCLHEAVDGCTGNHVWFCVASIVYFSWYDIIVIYCESRKASVKGGRCYMGTQ